MADNPEILVSVFLRPTFTNMESVEMRSVVTELQREIEELEVLKCSLQSSELLQRGREQLLQFNPAFVIPQGLPEGLVKFTATLGPMLGTAIGAWLHARYGRKVRLKIGEIEAEAQTVEEVETLLARAQEIQQRNQPPKVIP